MRTCPLGRAPRPAPGPQPPGFDAPRPSLGEISLGRRNRGRQRLGGGRGRGKISAQGGSCFASPSRGFTTAVGAHAHKCPGCGILTSKVAPAATHGAPPPPQFIRVCMYPWPARGLHTAYVGPSLHSALVPASFAQRVQPWPLHFIYNGHLYFLPDTCVCGSPFVLGTCTPTAHCLRRP